VELPWARRKRWITSCLNLHGVVQCIKRIVAWATAGELLVGTIADPRRHETPDYDSGFQISLFRISIQSTM
jgi:hypothetical protein